MVIGRILSKYEATPKGLSDAMWEINNAYPGSRLHSETALYIAGVGTVDVLSVTAAPIYTITPSLI